MECNIEGLDGIEEVKLPELDREKVRSLYALLGEVADYRARRGRRYEAAAVLVLLLLAKMAGEKTVSGAAYWVRLRGRWLLAALGIRRLPCANTYSYVLAHLDVAEVNAKVGEWLQQVRAVETEEAVEQWAIDGKVLRGSHRHTPTAQGGQEVLNVYAVASGQLTHCAPIAAKGYEAATAQAFVSETDCTGVVITADALHTRPRFCRRIRRRHGHYVLIVKGNRAELEAEIRQLFAMPPDPQSPVPSVRTVDAGHGRLTIRQLWASSELNLALQDEWQDVAQVFLLERQGTRQGKPFFQSVCGLTSLPPHLASPAQLLAWVQKHWHVENRCHWRRDATLGEDACTVRHHHVATVLSILNSAILAIMDLCQVTNVRKALRFFAAFPMRALSFLTLSA